MTGARLAGWVDADMEEARIYASALTCDEVRALGSP